MNGKMKNFLSCLFIALTASACGSYQPDMSGNMNKLEGKSERVEINFAPWQEKISKDSANTIADTVAGYPHGNPVAAVIYLPEGRAGHSPLAQRRAASVKKKLEAIGIDKSSIAVEHSDASSKDTIEAEIRFINMKLADCEKQRTKMFDYYMNYKSRDFGCTNNHNIGAMTADKRDAIVGNKENNNKSDPDNAVGAITTYKAGYATKSGGSSESSSSSSSSSSNSSGGK